MSAVRPIQSKFSNGGPPLIGITCYTPAATGTVNYSVPCDYIDALRRAGAQPLLLPCGSDAALATAVDAVLLAGGGDIDPVEYGCRESHATNYSVDPERDRFELALARAAFRLRVPILAVCRGIQILNVALGGDLVQHVPDRYGEEVLHRLPTRKATSHDVVMKDDSRVAEILDSERLAVVSWHHQAVDRLGQGLVATAWADDGVIEAVEASDPDAWIVGVQWHPEVAARTCSVQQGLFDAFCAAANDYSHRRAAGPSGTSEPCASAAR